MGSFGRWLYDRFDVGRRMVTFERVFAIELDLGWIGMVW
jgi:hypothetical protein